MSCCTDCSETRRFSKLSKPSLPNLCNRIGTKIQFSFPFTLNQDGQTQRWREGKKNKINPVLILKLYIDQPGHFRYSENLELSEISEDGESYWLLRPSIHHSLFHTGRRGPDTSWPLHGLASHRGVTRDIYTHTQDGRETLHGNIFLWHCSASVVLNSWVVNLLPALLAKGGCGGCGGGLCFTPPAW